MGEMALAAGRYTTGAARLLAGLFFHSTRVLKPILMIDKFLRAPHWQLFLFSFGVPFLMQLLGSTVAVSHLVTATPLGEAPAWPYLLSSAGSLAIGTVLYGWSWSVGHGLQQRMPREFRKSTIGFSAVLFTLAFLCLLSSFSAGKIDLLVDDSNALTLLAWTMLPLFGVWMLSHLYVAVYLADVILTFENECEPGRHELIQLSLVIWLFPVGIWLVQPRINRLARVAKQAREASPQLVLNEQGQAA